MGFSCFGEELLTADGTNVRVYTPFKTNKPIFLLAIRYWYVLYNDPTFTNIRLDLYSDNGGSLSVPGTPKVLWHSSTNTIDKATLLTGGNTSGARETYFEFDYIHLQANTWYHAVSYISGYTGTSSSHVAARRMWEDPVYSRNDESYGSLAIAPFGMTAIIGSELEEP